MPDSATQTTKSAIAHLNAAMPEPRSSFVSAVAEEGFSRMSAIFETICALDSSLEGVTFNNPNGYGRRLTFGEERRHV